MREKKKKHWNSVSLKERFRASAKNFIRELLNQKILPGIDWLDSKNKGLKVKIDSISQKVAMNQLHIFQKIENMDLRKELVATNAKNTMITAICWCDTIFGDVLVANAVNWMNFDSNQWSMDLAEHQLVLYRKWKEDGSPGPVEENP